MNIIEGIKSRRSIRKYVPNSDISNDDVQKILEAGMMAPSAKNTRPWEFIVIRNKEIRKEIISFHPHCKGMILDAILIIVTIARDDIANKICEGYWPQDCACATENMLLAALELGYGTCWCGVYPNKSRVESLKRLLKVQHGTPFNFIVLGKADENPPLKGYFDAKKVFYID